MADNLTFCINHYFQKYPASSVKYELLTLDQFLKCFKLKEELTQSINISLESEEKYLPTLESPVQVFIKKLPKESLPVLGACMHSYTLCFAVFTCIQPNITILFYLYFLFLQVLRYLRYVCVM